MRNRLIIALLTLLALALLATSAHANARLVSVTPVDGGCVAGPIGLQVEAWDLEPLKTYTLTIDDVTECSGATINVMVQNWYGTYVDLVATMVSTGVYSFQLTVPGNSCGTSPIRYCVTPGEPSTGHVVGRHDTGLYQSHLRYSAWDAGCLNPVEIACPPVPALQSTWGMIKTLYR
jgi:hypothetical protein